ncbi:hypothetical protein P8452_72829 [Trifolium repens]|nr:hypothetical protein P8452_72829 [Trifolium repens]
MSTTQTCTKYDLRKVEEVYYDVKIRGLTPNGESVADQGIERLKINATQKNDKKKMKRSEWNGENGKKRRKIVVPSFFAITAITLARFKKSMQNKDNN